MTCAYDFSRERPPAALRRRDDAPPGARTFDASAGQPRGEWTTQPRFVYRHEWSPGDMLIWDNTGVLHRVDDYPLDCGRVMHRTTLRGEEAFA